MINFFCLWINFLIFNFDDNDLVNKLFSVLSFLIKDDGLYLVLNFDIKVEFLVVEKILLKIFFFVCFFWVEVVMIRMFLVFSVFVLFIYVLLFKL